MMLVVVITRGLNEQILNLEMPDTAIVLWVHATARTTHAGYL